MIRILAALAVTAILAAPPAPGQAQATDPRAAIEEQIVDFENAFDTGNADALAALYTEEAAIFPPGSERVEGREQIGAFWESVMEQGASDLDLGIVELEVADGTATEVGNFEMTVPGGQQGGRDVVRGQYFVVWKRGEDGIWRLHRDIWNLRP